VAIYYPIAKSAKFYFFVDQFFNCKILSSIYVYGGFMEGLEGKEERSFLHLLYWQYRSSSLRQIIISLVLRILPLQSWIWHFFA